MYIIVDEEIAVLKVLTFGDAVSGKQHVYFLVNVRVDSRFLFRDWREKRQDFVKVELFSQLQS